ncbi:hypothetical protein P8610_15745 [Fictibacillus sp. UD]
MRPLTAQSGKGLTACPAESEAAGTKINYFQKQQSLGNILTKSIHIEFYAKI